MPICRRCSNEFTLLRCVAGVIDWVVLPPALFLWTALVWLMLIGIVESTTDIVVIDTGSELEDTKPSPVVLVLRASAWLIPLISYLLFCAKDGFSGYSPGKQWLELHVIDQQTGEPIGFVQSIKRNCGPAAICFLAAFAAVQLRYGPRVGDEIAKTKVIWLKYAKSPVFDVSPLPVAGATIGTAISEPLPEDGNPFRAPQG